MPAFAIGRTQEVIWVLDDLVRSGRIPRVPLYLDSPMASKATVVYHDHPETYDEETAQLLRSGDSPLKYPGQQFTDSVEESKAIRHANRPIMVVASSGMLTGGRIMHHLKDFLPDPKCTLLFIGYQGEGTLGRHLQEGGKTARIDGQEFPVRCRVRSVSGFSAHADQHELEAWLAHRAALGILGGPPCRPGPGSRSRAPRTLIGDVEVVEGGAPWRLPRLQPERQGPHRRLGLLRAAAQDGDRVLRRWPGTRCPTPSSRTSPCNTVPSRYERLGGRGRRHRRRCPLSGAPAGARRASRDRGRGRRPVAAELREAARRAASRPAIAPPDARPCRARRPRIRPPRRAGSVPWRRHCPPRQRATPTARCLPTGRRRSTQPLLVISQAADKADALAGLDRWRARHPEAAAHVRDPEDVLVDAMRGRYKVWWRIRVNLRNVPVELRPAAEPPDPDYDPWTEGGS